MIVDPIKKAYERFLKIRGTPEEIARGMALGVFVGMSPYIGFHTVIAVFFAAVLKWNKFSAAVGVQITNVFTAAFVYRYTYMVGAFFWETKRPFKPPEEFTLAFVLEVIKKAPEFFWILTIGGLVTGIPLALLTYYFSFIAAKKYQEDIKEKLIEKKEKLKEGRKQRKSNKMKKKGKKKNR